MSDNVKGTTNIREVGRSACTDGWMLLLGDGSMVFCPNNKCAIKPSVGEAVDLEYLGRSWRIIGIKIGDPPRDYGAVPPDAAPLPKP